MRHIQIGYIYILLTVLFTTYGQLVLKWQMPGADAVPAGAVEKVVFFIKLIFKPWVFSTFVAAFLASLTWMAALTRFELSHAYPFMSLSFILVFLLGVVLLNEAFSLNKFIGTAIIIAGLVVLNR